MAHLDPEQGNAWKLALETQKIQVTWTNTNIELATLLDTMVQNQVPLPDLILIDIDIKSKPADRFSESSQAETVCRWIWKTQAATKVVILYPQVNKISELEHRWGIRRGAAAVLPKLDRENTIASIQKINNILACDFLDAPLQSVVALLPSHTSDRVPTEELLVPPPLDPQEPDSGNAGGADSPDRAIAAEQPSELNSDEIVLIYRGVKIAEKEMPRAARIALDRPPQDIALPQLATHDDDYVEIVYRGVRMKKSRSSQSQ